MIDFEKQQNENTIDFSSLSKYYDVEKTLKVQNDI